MVHKPVANIVLERTNLRVGQARSQHEVSGKGIFGRAHSPYVHVMDVADTRYGF